MESTTSKNKKQKIVLVGNPNTGKSTIFNALTGLNQKIGNFPGVTVDKKTGSFSYQEKKYEVIGTNKDGPYRSGETNRIRSTK